MKHPGFIITRHGGSENFIHHWRGIDIVKEWEKEYPIYRLRSEGSDHFNLDEAIIKIEIIEWKTKPEDSDELLDQILYPRKLYRKFDLMTGRPIEVPNIHQELELFSRPSSRPSGDE